jgi:micrococcal nuclease
MIQQPYIYKALVLRVIDGDTIDCEVDVGFRMTTVQRLRLARINCPEMNGPSSAAGIEAKKWVSNAVAGTMVIVETSKDDAFGRWLAEVYYKNSNGEEFNLSSDLLRFGHAVPYERRK